MKLISSTATSLHVSWEARSSDKIQGFVVHYKHGTGGFIEERLSRQLNSKLLSGLQCGTTYTIYLTAFNDVGHSEPSEFLEAATNGKRKHMMGFFSCFSLLSQYCCIRVTLE